MTILPWSEGCHNTRFLLYFYNVFDNFAYSVIVHLTTIYESHWISDLFQDLEDVVCVDEDLVVVVGGDVAALGELRVPTVEGSLRSQIWRI